MIGGGLVGTVHDCGAWICEGVAVGAVLGEVIGTAAGAHLGNAGRGSFAKSLGMSAGVAGLGIAVAAGTDAEGVLMGTAAVQVIAVTLTETRSSPWIEPTGALQPTPEGMAVQLGLRIR